MLQWAHCANVLAKNEIQHNVGFSKRHLGPLAALLSNAISFATSSNKPSFRPESGSTNQGRTNDAAGSDGCMQVALSADVPSPSTGVDGMQDLHLYPLSKPLPIHAWIRLTESAVALAIEAGVADPLTLQPGEVGGLICSSTVSFCFQQYLRTDSLAQVNSAMAIQIRADLRMNKAIIRKVDELWHWVVQFVPKVDGESQLSDGYAFAV